METKQVLAALAALAQEARLRIFRALVGSAPQGMTPSALSALLDVPASTLSFHLKELVNAGLAGSEAQGRHVCYRARFDAMNALVAYLTHNCCAGSGDDGCAPGATPTRRC